MTLISRADWRKWKTPGDKDIIIVTCPTCRCEGSIHIGEEEHSINNEGFVNPSAVCPFTEKCNFHDYIKLEGWEI